MQDKLRGKFEEYESNNEWCQLFVELKNESIGHMKGCSVKVAKQAENFKKNRYRDVLPYDHSRVILSSADSDYINASYVPISEAGRHHILTQGPLESTAGHFWQMVWEQKSKAVIMLNRVIEKNTSYGDSDSPEASDTVMSFEDTGFEVRLLEEDPSEHFNFCLRKLELKHIASGKCREVLHFQFTAWPDFGVPERSSDFLEFLLAVRRSGSLSKDHGPPVVHCSAGVGRSGTFIIVDAALVIAHSKGSSYVDLPKMVVELRKYRFGLIQTADQLRFCWKTVLDALDDEQWQMLLECGADDYQAEEPGEKRHTTGKRPLAGATGGVDVDTVPETAEGCVNNSADIASSCVNSPPQTLAEMSLGSTAASTETVSKAEEMPRSPHKRARPERESSPPPPLSTSTVASKNMAPTLAVPLSAEQVISGEEQVLIAEEESSSSSCSEESRTYGRSRTPSLPSTTPSVSNSPPDQSHGSSAQPDQKMDLSTSENTNTDFVPTKNDVASGAGDSCTENRINRDDHVQHSQEEEQQRSHAYELRNRRRELESQKMKERLSSMKQKMHKTDSNFNNNFWTVKTTAIGVLCVAGAAAVGLYLIERFNNNTYFE